MNRFLTTSLLPFGRAPRWQMWLFFLVNVAISVGWTALQASFAEGNPAAARILDHMGQNYLAYSVGYLVFVAMTAMVMWNRYHDIGRTGWNMLWLAVPVLVAVAAYTVTSLNVVDKLGLPYEAAHAISRFLWLLFWPLSVFLSLAIHLRCLFTPGDAHANRYGPPPR